MVHMVLMAKLYRFCRTLHGLQRRHAMAPLIKDYNSPAKDILVAVYWPMNFWPKPDASQAAREQKHDQDDDNNTQPA